MVISTIQKQFLQQKLKLTSDSYPVMLYATKLNTDCPALNEQSMRIVSNSEPMMMRDWHGCTTSEPPRERLTEESHVASRYRWMAPMQQTSQQKSGLSTFATMM